MKKTLLLTISVLLFSLLSWGQDKEPADDATIDAGAIAESCKAYVSYPEFPSDPKIAFAGGLCVGFIKSWTELAPHMIIAADGRLYEIEPIQKTINIRSGAEVFIKYLETHEFKSSEDAQLYISKAFLEAGYWKPVRVMLPENEAPAKPELKSDQIAAVSLGNWRTR